MYHKCTTEVSVQNQRKVTTGLLELMKKMSFEDITVTELCQVAGVTRRVFYHLFSNKTGALHALIDQKVLAFEGYCADVPDEILRFFCYWRDQKAFLDVLQGNGMSGLLLERMINLVLEEDFVVRHWLRNNGWPHNDKEVIIFGFTGLMGLVYSWHYADYDQTPEELAAVVKQTLHPQFNRT